MGGRGLAATFISLRACPYSGQCSVGEPEAWTAPMKTRLPSAQDQQSQKAWLVLLQQKKSLADPPLPVPRLQKARGPGNCMVSWVWERV